MKCPNCEKKMKHKKGTGMHFDTSGTAEDYELLFTWERYKCKDCKITYDGNKWFIPGRYEPTEKQINTILFINNRLNMDLPMLTKHQCQADIGKYFEKAKCVPEHDPYSDGLLEEMQGFFGPGGELPEDFGGFPF